MLLYKNRRYQYFWPCAFYESDWGVGGEEVKLY